MTLSQTYFNRCDKSWASDGCYGNLTLFQLLGDVISASDYHEISIAMSNQTEISSLPKVNHLGKKTKW